MGWESCDVFRFDLRPLLQGETRIVKFKTLLITRLLLVLEVSNVKPICRKSWAGKLFMWSGLVLAPPSRSNKNSKTQRTTHLLLCHQHSCCVAYRDCFVILFCGVGIVITLCILDSISKWFVRFNSNLACGCHSSSSCALWEGDLKLPVVTYLY